MLRDTLAKIASEFSQLRNSDPTNHPLAQFIRHAAPAAVREALGNYSEALTTQGSPGRGNISEVPWLAVFDPFVTSSAVSGYYVVYLFAADGSSVSLSLAQGTTAVRNEFKARARSILKDRADMMRSRIKEFSAHFPATAIQLLGDGRLALDYEASHILGKTYPASDLPSDDSLRSDLQEIVRAYLTLTHRGGLDPSPDAADPTDDLPPTYGGSLVELRQYRMHRRIERNKNAAAKVKSFHGTTCQACGFSFPTTYGELGNGFIEAHHLKPIAGLAEGVPVTYAIETDFAVLCSNCHRMIHRSGSPENMDAFKSVLKK